MMLTSKQASLTCASVLAGVGRAAGLIRGQWAWREPLYEVRKP